MKFFVANILFLLLTVAPFTASAQYQYMFDLKSDKQKRTIKGDIDMLKTNVDEYKKAQKLAKEERRASRKTMNHTYRIQKRYVRKRMMASRCEAARFNGDHNFLCEPLHQFWRHGELLPFHLWQRKCKMTAKK